MTQDPWGQPLSSGYVVRGDVVPNDESGAPQAGQAPPMTYFQKVAGRADQPVQPASRDPDETPAEEDEHAEDPAAEPAGGTVASASGPATDPGASPAAQAGQAEEPADQAPPDGHDATGPSMTQPNMSGGSSRPPAATVPTVPIAVAAAPADDGGRHAAPEAKAEAELRPGESGTTLGLGESGYASLVTDTAGLREQWHRIQYKFVDDPRASVTEAADVIAQVATRLEAAIAERQRGLRGRWDTSGTVDTETLRETLRMYRAFLDQLIGPEPS